MVDDTKKYLRQNIVREIIGINTWSDYHVLKKHRIRFATQPSTLVDPGGRRRQNARWDGERLGNFHNVLFLHYLYIILCISIYL